MNIEKLEKNIIQKEKEKEKINKLIESNNKKLIEKKKKLINYINIMKFRIKKEKEKIAIKS